MATKYYIVFLSFLLWINVAAAQSEKEQFISPEGDTLLIEAIPLSQISAALEAGLQQLRKINKHYKDDTRIHKFDSIFEVKMVLLNKKKAHFEQNKKSYTTREMNNSASEWNTYEKLVMEWRELVDSRIILLEQDLSTLNMINEVWKLTLKEAKNAKAPPTVISNANEMLKNTKEEKLLFTRLQNEMLKRQNKLSKMTLSINEVINSLKELKEEKQSDYFAQDSSPIWEAGDSTLSPATIKEHFENTSRENIQGLKLFFDSYKRIVYFHFFLFLLIWVAFYFLGKQAIIQSEDENNFELEQAKTAVSRHEISALVISLFLSIWLYPDLNSIISDIIQFIYIIIAIIFFPVFIDKKLRPVLYAILALFFFDQMQIFFPVEMIFTRLVLFIKSLLAVWVLSKLIDEKGIAAREMNRTKLGLVLKLLYVFFIFLALSILGNIFGFLSLAVLLSNAVVNSIITLIIVMLVVTMVNRAIIILLRSKFIRKSNYINNNWQLVEKWMRTAVVVVSLLLWLKVLALQLNLFDPIYNWFIELRQISWEVGKHSNPTIIELGSIIDFFFVLILTFLIYQIIKTLLEEELFPRVKLPRGVPGAISMIVGYVIVAYGIFLSLVAAGIDLSEFGLMAGALGVGIGFGLQNIVANFIAGLILAFERPIQVGDTIEAGTVMGDVKHIGVRATTIRTFDGSEVMVPNGNMIANDVINWTLSDRKKRRDIFVSVAYGSNPHKVLEVIKKVGEDNPNVLQIPAPWALFEGFGDSSLNFRLRIWTAMDVGLTTKSEVAMSIYDALNEAGIEIPFPQQDLHVKSFDPSIQEIIVPKIGKSKTEK